jgi:hypothetical protein
MARFQTACPRISCPDAQLNPRCTDRNVARTMTRINGIAYRVLPWAPAECQVQLDNGADRGIAHSEHVLVAESGGRRVLDRAVDMFRGTVYIQYKETARYHQLRALRVVQAIFPTGAQLACG